jgi:hypothetical protein
MESFSVSVEAPPQWDAICSTHNNLFHSTPWQHLLKRAFGSKTIYAWDRENENGLAITVFNAGPFKIGYVGFPAGGTVSGNALPAEKIIALKEVQLPVSLHVLRIPVSAFSDSLEIPLPFVATRETAISDLGEWNVPSLPPRIRRDIKKALRTSLQTSDIGTSADGRGLHRLYQHTVKHRGGTLRYNAKYFEALAELSNCHKGLRCCVALAAGELAGFIVTALSGKTAYYLHAAINPSFRRYAPGDLLLYESIQWAQSQSMDCFNLMSSPADQPSLIRYKQKWGGVTREHCTYELPIKALSAAIFRFAQHSYSRLVQHLRISSLVA